MSLNQIAVVNWYSLDVPPIFIVHTKEKKLFFYDFIFRPTHKRLKLCHCDFRDLQSILGLMICMPQNVIISFIITLPSKTFKET